MGYKESTNYLKLPLQIEGYGYGV